MLASKSQLQLEQEKNNCLQIELGKLQTDNQKLASQVEDMEVADEKMKVDEDTLVDYKKQIEDLSSE